MYVAALCSLVVLTGCGGGDSDGPGGLAGDELKEGKGGASLPALTGPDAKPSIPKPSIPKPSLPPKPGVFEATEFKDFPHQALPLSRLKMGDCPSYTAALADYGNHPSGGMVQSKGSVEFPGANDCTGWRTGDEDTIRDIKAGHMEYELGYNCSPTYPNIDQMGDRINEHKKNVSQSKPGTTYSPLYRLPEIGKGFVFSVLREGTNGSSGVTATFVTDEGLCTAGLTVKCWAPNENGKGLKYVGLNEAETFKEFSLILNAMLGG